MFVFRNPETIHFLLILLDSRYLHKEVNVGPSQRRMGIGSEFLKEEYEERLTVLLTIIVYEEQTALMGFIRSEMN